MAPYLDKRLFAHPTRTRALQNIGGIGNVTYLAPPAPEIALDTGPGNMLIDFAATRATGGEWEYDHRPFGKY